MRNQIFFNIHAPDGDCYWIPEFKSPKYCCEECGSKFSRKMFNPDFYVKKKRDIVFTYDGFMIGSSRLIDALNLIDTDGFTAQVVPENPKYKTAYFVVEFVKVVRINTSSPLLEIGPVCSKCGQPKYVVGSDAEVIDDVNPDGFFRSDLEFADGWEKGPLYFVGAHAASILKAAKIDGLTLIQHFKE